MKKIIIAMMLMLSACTANSRAKHWGGTETINLPACQKLVNATWKDAQLWYLTRPMREGETLETLSLHEQSNLGLVQGTVVFVESCK